MPARWTSLIGAALRLRLARRIALLNNAAHWKANSAAIQRRELLKLLSAAQHTEFGRAHGFARLAALPEREVLPAYRKALPVADWYAFREPIAKMREHAQPDILWPGLIRDFAQTSGTTAGDKYIPVSREMLRSNFHASLDIFANAARFGIPLSRITAGRSLFLGGSTDLSTSPQGIRTGDLSGLVAPLIRWPISAIYSPGPQIALMNHWPSKIEAMAKACLSQDIRMISGMPSWAIVLMERIISLAREQGRDVSTIREIWPNLELFVHGGVKYTPFDPRVRRFWSGGDDDIPHRLELYPASEGFVAMQDTPHNPGLRLCTDIGLFHEFVPLESINVPDPPAFACDEVDKGQRYVVVLSTCAGLWRYILGDVVEFDSIPARLGWSGHSVAGSGYSGHSVPGSISGSGDGPARLRIVGRHKHFINAFGENLIVEHIENAVAAAAKSTGLVVGEFTAAPVYPRDGQKGALELAIEISQPSALSPQSSVLSSFRDAIDRSLKEQNVDYTTKRTDSLSMVEPRISPLPPGTFHRWMASRGKLGGQHKCPRCANSRDIIDAVLQSAEPYAARYAARP